MLKSIIRSYCIIKKQTLGVSPMFNCDAKNLPDHALKTQDNRGNTGREPGFLNEIVLT